MKRGGRPLPGGLLVALALTLFAGGLRAQEPIPLEETDEAFLDLRYETVVATVISARFYEDSVYLPVGALFGALRINYSLDPPAARVEGFYIDPGNDYLLDLGRGEARIDRRHIELSPGSHVVGEVDLYVLPSVLEAVFGIRVDVSLRSLTARVTSQRRLPIHAARQRERRRAGLEEEADVIRPAAPLRYPRTPSWLDAGVMQYAVASSLHQGDASGSLDLGFGAQIAGGALSTRLAVSARSEATNVSVSGTRWDYVMRRESRLLNHVALGALRSEGLAALEFNGVSLTNEPTLLRRRLGTHVVHGTTGPGWEVEMHLGGQLLGFARADPTGRFQFNMPLVYGTSVITLRFYGPQGEFEEEVRRVQVPFVFLPAGQLDYRVSAGRATRDDAELLQAGATYGVTDRLSVRGGYDYLSGGDLGEEAIAYAGASARLPPNQIVGVLAAPGAFNRASLEGFFGTQASYSLTYTDFDGESSHNLAGTDRELSYRAFVPLGPLPTTLRAHGVERWRESGARSSDLEISSVLNLPRLKPTVGYGRSTLSTADTTVVLSQEVFAGTLLQLGRVPGPLGFLSRALLSGSLAYDLELGEVGSSALGISHGVGRHGRLGLNVRHARSLTRFEVSYLLNRPTSQTNVQLAYDGDRAVLGTSLRGAAGYDAGSRSVVFSNRSWMGLAAASVRLFVDIDGDGVYQEGEPVIPADAVRFRQTLPSRVDPDGVLRTTDLLPYQQYSIDIDVSRIRNPLWVPAFESFSFMADPNAFKQVEVPFYVAGVIEGTVMRSAAGGEPRAVPGLRVRVRGVDNDVDLTLSTFSDGSYYHMGLPPGEYEASVDPAQVRILDARSRPEVRSFRVRVTAEGDYVEGLDFLLETG